MENSVAQNGPSDSETEADDIIDVFSENDEE